MGMMSPLMMYATKDHFMLFAFDHELMQVSEVDQSCINHKIKLLYILLLMKKNILQSLIEMNLFIEEISSNLVSFLFDKLYLSDIMVII